MKRLDLRRVARVRIRVLLFEPCGDCLHVCAGLLFGHAGFEPRYQLQVMRAALKLAFGKRKRSPQLRVRWLYREAEVAPQHADDCKGLAFNRERLSKHSRVRAEPSLPEAVTEDHHAVFPRL